MLRVVISLTLLCFSCLSAGAQAQWFDGMVPGLNQTAVGSFVAGWRPSFKLEYQHMSASINAPAIVDLVMRYPGQPAFTIPDVSDEVDLALKDANLWVGLLGIEAPVSRACSIFGSVGTNFSRYVGVESEQARLVGVSTGSDPRNWDAANLRWTFVDAGIRYRAFGGCSLLTGLRFRHLSFGLENPVNSEGDPYNYDNRVVGSQVISQRLLGDVQIKSWLPYIGIMTERYSYRFALIFAPWASTRVKLPFSAHQQSQDAFLPISGETELSWRFRAFQPCLFLEGTFEHEIMTRSSFTFLITASGSWLRMKGPINSSVDIFTQGSFFGSSLTSTVDGSANPEGTFTQSIVSIGFEARGGF